MNSLEVFNTVQVCRHCKVLASLNKSTICPVGGSHAWVVELIEQPPQRSGWLLTLLLSWDAIWWREQ